MRLLVQPQPFRPEFGLAAQANSFDEAKLKITKQIEEYLREAFEEDVEHKEALLSRKGPISWYFMYYFAKLHLAGRELFAFTETGYHSPNPA
jgi:hypothetical protein